MTFEQKLLDITVDDLLVKVQELADQGYRLIQIGCTRTQTAFEVNYSFDLNLQLINLKITLPNQEMPIPSISLIFAPAFLYENEISDLFGLKISAMSIDFQGNFYRTSVKNPFSQPAAIPQKPVASVKEQKSE